MAEFKIQTLMSLVYHCNPIPLCLFYFGGPGTDRVLEGEGLIQELLEGGGALPASSSYIHSLHILCSPAPPDDPDKPDAN